MPSIRLPADLSGVTSVTLRRWLVEPGAAFAVGDVLAELEAEESLVHLQVPTVGRLSGNLAAAGATFAPGDAIAHFDAADGQPTFGTSPTSSSLQPGVSTAINTPAIGQGSSGSGVPILMPQAGNTMEEGTILKWLVKEGDTISAGQVICEIETDKATMEFEAPESGRLAKIVAGEGQTVAVKSPIAFLGEGEVSQVPSPAATPAPAKASTPPSAAPSPAVVDSVVPASAQVGGRIKVSPAARVQASAAGIDLASIGAGSGPGGRILSTDLAPGKPAASSSGKAAAFVRTAPSVEPLASACIGPAAAAGKVVRTPMTKMRRAIGANLLASKQTIPHFYLRLTIDADPLLAFYRRHKPATACTVNDVVVLAVGRMMREFPAIRSRIDGDAIIESPSANIGIAVGIDDGLVVPVVTHVDRLSLAELAASSRRVVDNARKGKLENVGKGNFTITNLGMFGIEEFAAIINPPESAILAVAAAREDVIVRDGMLRPGRVMTMTLSSDHRIVDGVIGARFLRRLKEVLESPDMLEA